LAADGTYPKCIHVQVMEELTEVFDAENGISPSLEGNSHLSLDHNYQVGQVYFIVIYLFIYNNK